MKDLINIKKVDKLYLGLWLILLIAGLVGLVMKFSTGEKLAGYGSYVPWGLWVALYFHFVGIAGGVAITGIMGYILNIGKFRNRLFQVGFISFACLITGLFSIWIDLGKPFRFSSVFLSPNYGSMLTFNSWMYVTFMAVFGFAMYLYYKKSDKSTLKDKSGWLFPFLIFALMIAFALPSQSGAFFGVIDAKAFWNSALLPVLFLISGIVSGGAMLLLVFSIIYKDEYAENKETFKYLRNIVSVGILIYLFAEIAEFSIVLWSTNSHSAEAIEQILFGPYWWMFFIVHLGGAILALVLLNNKITSKSIQLGALVVVVTFIATRLNILIPGQTISNLKGLKEAFYDPRLTFTYHATLNEYLVASFIVAFAIFAIYFGLQIGKKLTSKN
ncbi:MAG: NrfD/PsrC family molybdoenzyme membrane anchor subunit [Lutibacter sp.]